MIIIGRGGGGVMAYGVVAEAASGRSGEPFGATVGRTSNAHSPQLTEAAARIPHLPELDCIRDLLSEATLNYAERRAFSLDVEADHVLIASGAISEEAYARALARHLDVLFEPLDGRTREMCPLSDERLIVSAARGVVPLVIGGVRCLVIAPRAAGARRLMQSIQTNRAQAGIVRFTSIDRINRFVLQNAREKIAAEASDGLKTRWPILSAARGERHRIRAAAVAVVSVLAALAAMTVAPTTAFYALEIALGAVFLGWTGLRLFGACVDRTAAKPAPRWPDDQLPTYSVVAALYREAACVDDLLEAIESLDYPREKLDVILAVEADDDETIAAINARKTRLPITLIEVPPLGPRTKPKALNVALTFARGTFTVIFDAEDRPDATQLRRAVQAFSGAGDDLACVQAHLCIDNTRDSWLTHLFTAEYAGQFDVFLPGIAALHLPLPLGGSSNHFRTDTLRKVGGWDAYNMTEDADLGLRLARFGYRTGMIASTTYEEAPAEFGPWLRQRTRWYKGWMQTWLVHMRRPRRLFAELGFAGFTVFQLLVGGNVLAALVHPLFFAGWFYALISGYPTWAEDEMARMLAACYGGNLVVGYLTSAFLGWLGLRCRGLLSIAWMLIVMPLYWLILSLAAWRGLYQLMTAPYLWEKTEHGLARHSRRAESTTRSLHRLEHHLTRLQKSGELTRSADRPLVPDRLPQDIA